MEFVVGNEIVKVERIQFKDIVQGDKVIHLYRPLDDNEPALMWAGEAQVQGERTREWFGASRKAAMAPVGQDNFNAFVERVIDTTDLTIVSDWHDSEADGHTIFRIVK